MKTEVQEIQSQFTTNKNELVEISVCRIDSQKCQVVIRKDGVEHKSEDRYSNFINLEEYFNYVTRLNNNSSCLYETRHGSVYYLTNIIKLIIYTAGSKDTDQEVVVINKDNNELYRKSFPVTLSHEIIINEIINVLNIRI